MSRDDDDWVGRRVAQLRVTAGMTQEELARLVGCSRPYISMIESGDRPVTSRRLLIALTEALGVRIEDLEGQPRPPRSAVEHAAARMAPAIRAAIGEPDEPILPRPLRVLAQEVSTVRAAHMACDYPRVAETLPSLIAELRATFYDATSDRVRRDTMAVLVRACFTATISLRILGYLDLAVRLAERTSFVAEQLGDPVYRGVGHYVQSQMALAQGSRNSALRLARRAADMLQVDLDTDDRRAVYGMLHLQAALVAASLGDHVAAQDHLDEAAQVAPHVAGDPWQLEFTPTNVNLWRASVRLENGDPEEAAALARQVNRAKLRTNNRKARLYLDTGRAEYAAGRLSDATRAFLQAGQIAPFELRRWEVQEPVGQMVRVARRVGGSDELATLAVMAGIDPLNPPGE